MTARKHTRGVGLHRQAPEMIDQAQRRVTRALRSSRPEDAVIKAAFGALAASLAVRLVRQTPIGALAVRVVPILAFIGLYDRFARTASAH